MSMKKIAVSVILGMGVAATSGAFAASTADLSVIGTIVPSSCDITLSNNKVELGKISSSDLTADATTELQAKTLEVEVSCEAPAKFSLSAVDNTGDSAAVTADTAFGLGKTSNNEKFGHFSLRFNGTTLEGDSTSVIGLASTDKTTWAVAPTTPEPGSTVNGPALSKGSNYLAFGDGVGPAAVKDIKEFSGTLEVRTFIAAANSLTLDDDESFAGSATIEVNYF